MCSFDISLHVAGWSPGCSTLKSRIPVNVLEKAVTATHAGDLNEVSDSWLQPSPARAVVAFWGSEPVDGRQITMPSLVAMPSQ